jgi:predicted ATPase/class 3 adenylate cyclase
MNSQLPSGTVTFLFTDIQDSTRLAREHRDAWETLRSRHHALLHPAMLVHNGHVFQIIGDGFCVAFHTAGEALEAAVTAQRALQVEDWGGTPIRVRMGINTGAARIGDSADGSGGYTGYTTLARAQRVMSTAHAGQILLSNTSADLLQGELPDGVSLRAMGEHRLKGFLTPEHLWQVLAPGLLQDFPPLQTLLGIPNNLPFQTTSFIGRENELAEIDQLLGAAHLLTLTGSGGTGKTRLALQAAERVLDSFKDGVWWIELGPLSDPVLLPNAIASVLGIHEEPGRPLLAALTDWLRDRELLLILDNCEHLVQACSQFCDAVLRSSRTVRLLATSREALGIAGETAYRVPSLPVPDTLSRLEIDQLMGFASVQLFVERASQALTSFSLTPQNASAVAQICARLDGIPLAIELAASRVRTMGVEQVAQRLDDRFRLLTGGSRAALPRHQTLRAMIDWSYNLLSEAEQTLLVRLAVFSGGWTLESAEQVCGQVCGRKAADPDVLDLLANLVDKSLVLLDESGAGARYHILETTRQYAQEKLGESGAAEELRDRHLRHFLALAEEAEPHFHEASQLDWLERLDRELNNLRLALEWSQAGGREVEGGRTAAALYWYWYLRSHIREGHAWLARALQAGAAGSIPPDLKGRLLYRTAHLAHFMGEPAEKIKALLDESLELSQKNKDYLGIGSALVSLAWLAQDGQEAERLYEQALAASRLSDQPWLVPGALMNLADLMNDLGRHQQAVIYLEECILQFRRIGDRWGIAWSLLTLAQARILAGQDSQVADLLSESLDLFRQLNNKVGIRNVIFTRANLEVKRGDFEQAAQLFEQNLALAREMGLKRAIAVDLLRLAGALYHLGDYPRAAALTGECLNSCQEQGFQAILPMGLTTLAQVLTARSQPERAACLLGAAEAHAQALGQVLFPTELLERAAAVQALRKQLDAAAFDRVYAEGQALTLEQAVRVALQELI